MSNEPYIIEKREVIDRKYNPEYGDDRICKCGHSYYRHFDSYAEEMDPVGCKYCQCHIFEEDSEEERAKRPKPMNVIERPKDVKIDDLGNYRWWSKNLMPFKEDELANYQILPLYNISLMNPWLFLGRLGLENVHLMQHLSLHPCPYDSSLVFYGVMPILLLSDDIQKYRNAQVGGKEWFQSSNFDITWDDEWTKMMDCCEERGDKEKGEPLVKKYKVPDMQIYTGQMGHPYTDYTLHSDGSAELVNAKANLDNGDILVVKTWLWFNK